MRTVRRVRRLDPEEHHCGNCQQTRMFDVYESWSQHPWLPIGRTAHRRTMQCRECLWKIALPGQRAVPDHTGSDPSYGVT